MQRASLFHRYSRHVNPSKANDPGLVYDIQPEDYIPYLCGLGYTDEQVVTIVQKTVKCSQIKSIKDSQLNYPSFSLELISGHKTLSRTVTNVGDAESTYDVKIEAPPGVAVGITPKQLIFTSSNQKLTYQIDFGRVSGSPSEATYVEGAISWVSNKHVVRSPISIKWTAI
ncbi:hypothetical protein Leryth_003253 [Lithospermum erythrorhizon]|nr:hypothetical protein Leryth_003253 [Lithospermum erythrorhizon]